MEPLGCARLHLALATFLWRVAQDFVGAQRHFARCAAGDAASPNAAMLGEWMREAPPNEHDLLLTRVVLQYLSNQNLGGANAIFAAARTQCAGGADTPLLNFSSFLLQTCERDAAPLFEALCEKYAAALARDAALQQFLDRIGKVCDCVLLVCNVLSLV